jgi:hypothetical protein
MRSKSTINKIVSFVIVAVILVSVTVPVLAHQDSFRIQQFAQEKKNENAVFMQERKFEAAIQMLERYLSLSETGNIILNAPKGISKMIGNKTFESIIIGLNQTNRMIDSGYLFVNKDLTIGVTDKYLESNSQLFAEDDTVYLSEGIKSSSFTSINKVQYYWWGYKYYLSDANCNRLVAGLGIGAVLGILIPDPTLCKAVAIALGLSAGIVTIANAEGRGIVVRYTMILGITGIWSQ